MLEIFSKISVGNDNILVNKLLDCNKYTSKYGIVLSKENVKELIFSKNKALKNLGRVEFSESIMRELILEFSSSPFINNNCVNIFSQLMEVFYYYKNETEDFLSDKTLLKEMKRYFNTTCQGSVELLKDREMAQLSWFLKNGGKDLDILYEDLLDEYGNNRNKKGWELLGRQ